MTEAEGYYLNEIENIQTEDKLKMLKKQEQELKKQIENQ